MAARNPAPGIIVDNKYRLAERIGGGGMGDVYRAEHVTTGRPLAIKFLHPELTDNADLAHRFFQEAQAVNRIRHPNIVDVLDAGVGDLGPYIVMEYLEGESVGAALGRLGRFEIDAAIGTAVPVLEALDAAHRVGIIHRDLKPENVFIAFDISRACAVVRLLDFGIAKMLDGNGTMPRTRTGVVFGTPDYLSPEQATGEMQLDGRSDLFAVGVLMYELLTGTRPFRAPTAVATAFRVVHAEVPNLAATGVYVDPRVEAVVQKLLQKEPSRRFPTAGDVVRELNLLLPDQQRRTVALGRVINIQRRLAAASAADKEKKDVAVSSSRRPALSSEGSTPPSNQPVSSLSRAAPQPAPAPRQDPPRIELRPPEIRSSDIRQGEPTVPSKTLERRRPTAEPARPSAPIAAARRIGVRPFPERFVGRFQVRGPVLRAVDRSVVEIYGQRERDEVVKNLPAKYASDFVQGSINAMVRYELEELDAYMELATDLLLHDVERWRELGRHAVGGELYNVVKSLLRPSPDYSSLIRRGAIVWAQLFSFGVWKAGTSAAGRTTLQIAEFEPAASTLRQWVAGMLEETARRALSADVKVTITGGEMAFMPELTCELS
ncbi:MAG: serine/threonine protein kinase [Polyangiaceae bacterium]|nr:serine/threonine protein kinase [Polyangiaceae bacterium]